MRNTIIACIVSAALAVGLTKYYFPTIQTKTVEVEKEVVKTDVVTVTHTVQLPGGGTDTTITTTDHTQKVETDTKTQVVLKSPTINVSGLVANDFSHGGILPLYGVSVSKEFIGPVTLGLFGLTNGILGLSVGINF